MKFSELRTYFIHLRWLKLTSLIVCVRFYLSCQVIPLDIVVPGATTHANATRAVAGAHGWTPECFELSVDCGLSFCENIGTRIAHNAKTGHCVTPNTATVIGSGSSSMKSHSRKQPCPMYNITCPRAGLEEAVEYSMKVGRQRGRWRMLEEMPRDWRFIRTRGARVIVATKPPVW